jgi:p-hydroxybenzoate 3-monooxygenase
MQELVHRVCIIGAGPAGLVLGHILHQSGIPFIILERQDHADLRAITKAGLIEQRVVEALKPFGLADPILNCGARSGIAEFRLDGAAFILDYGRLTPDGKGHFIYAQNELVADWAEALVAAGGNIQFGARVVGIAETGDGAELKVSLAPDGKPAVLRAQIVVGCDGAGSIIARESRFPTLEVAHPFRWLAIIAAAAPPALRTAYGLHSRGFSAFMRRGPSSTRYYLEVPKEATHDEWPEDRIWQELEVRLAAAGHASPVRGSLLERDFLDLRVRVRQPMQKGNVFLAGDAAHMVTPAGGKGMNMAILDAIELASAICECLGTSADEARLGRYSAARIPEIWRYEDFSNWMLGLLHSSHALRGDGSLAAQEFALGLRRARLDRMVSDTQFARWFAETYAGI